MFDYISKDYVKVFINGYFVDMHIDEVKQLANKRINENTKYANERAKKQKIKGQKLFGETSQPSEPQVEDPDVLLKKWIKLYTPKIKFEDFDKTGEGTYNFVENENMVRLRTKIENIKPLLDANSDKADDYIVHEDGRKISKIKEEYEKRLLAKRIWERKFEVEHYVNQNSGFGDSDIINKETGKTLGEYKNIKERLNSGLTTLKGYES